MSVSTEIHALLPFVIIRFLCLRPLQDRLHGLVVVPLNLEVRYSAVPPTTPLGLPVPGNEISTGSIYGAVYPQIWDFQDTPIVLNDGYSTFSIYPTLDMKITVNGPNLKKATISTLSCGTRADKEGDNAIGSCKLTGSLIPEATVATKVPAGCQ